MIDNLMELDTIELRALAQSTGPLDAQALMAMTGLPESAVDTAIVTLMKAGFVAAAAPAKD